MADNLDNNTNDLLVSVAKSVVGIVPIAGSLLSELVGVLIPNQRIDRLTKYVIELDEKISKIPSEKINSLLKNDEFIDLIEEGFVQASRAITDVRRNYIASIISNGISDETIQLNESKQLLKILAELNDIEIIWLRFYSVLTTTGDEEFRQNHKNILTDIQIFMGADNETLTRSAIQNSYKVHLERLELIEHRIKVDNKTKMPEFERFTGKPKKSGSTITILGRLLLKQIGLIDNIN
jgi:hypothetical protein